MSAAAQLVPVSSYENFFADRGVVLAETPALELVKQTAEQVGSLVEDSTHLISSQEGGDIGMVKAPASVERNFSGWSEIKQAWEGRVVEHYPDDREFVAIISDRTNKSNPDEEVVIGYESVLESDVGLISEGAIFFWNVGTYRKLAKVSGKIGPAMNKWELRFRRLPPISQEVLEEIKEYSKGLSKLIHGN
ncbi:hypothetical protein [Pseudomonas sp. 1121_17]|uniref:hypothetical protein n=1 Tax=Pseudomonas sp. 1121_17 TaxID=2604458 RepID=UPI004064B331